MALCSVALPMPLRGSYGFLSDKHGQRKATKGCEIEKNCLT
jgi:hypothetical protein